MRQVTESDPEADWIRPFLFGAPKPARAIPQVRDRVPAGFGGYGRLLHTMFNHQDVDDTIEAGDPPDWYGRKKHAALAVTLEEVARRHGLAFDETIAAPDIVQKIGHEAFGQLYTGPESGYIVPWQLEALIAVLREETEDAEVHYYYDLEALGMTEEPRLYAGTLNDYLKTWDMDDVLSSPTYAWPASRDWLVCSLESCDFSMICGRERLIDVLLAHPTLECIQVALDTPIRR